MLASQHSGNFVLAVPILTLEPENAIITASLLGSSMPLNEKRGDNMATSSITANFHCDNAKAANIFVDLLLSEKPPAKWVAPVPTGTAQEFRCPLNVDYDQMLCVLSNAPVE